VKADPKLVFSISHTTRARREGERDGVDYHFVTREEFLRLVAKGAFLEHAEYRGNLYGTSYAAIREPLARGNDVLLEIDVQGARQVRERLPEARFVFLLPPSRQELERRLRSRGTDAPEVIERRLAAAEEEFRAVDLYDYAVFNERLPETIETLLAIVRAERAGDPAPVRARHGREAERARLERLLGSEA
jgi:guanylate kinase